MKRYEGELVLRELDGRQEQSLLKWFGLMKRMEDRLMRIVGSEVSGVRLRGSP